MESAVITDRTEASNLSSQQTNVGGKKPLWRQQRNELKGEKNKQKGEKRKYNKKFATF